MARRLPVIRQQLGGPQAPVPVVLPGRLLRLRLLQVLRLGLPPPLLLPWPGRWVACLALSCAAGLLGAQVLSRLALGQPAGVAGQGAAGDFVWRQGPGSTAASVLHSCRDCL